MFCRISNIQIDTERIQYNIGMFCHFSDQSRSITSNRFVLNIVQGYHLQLRSCPSLFHYFWQFNVKAPVAHHPIIQKEVDELPAKGME